jgi:hypothetical protein
MSDRMDESRLAPWARRPLSQGAGGIVESGDPRIASRLAEAFRAAAGSEPDTLTHGFHTWPARMHPSTARALLSLGPSEGAVLDPFMGGGTVLVEARVLGREAIGVDVNPLAQRVASVRCDAPPPEARAMFLARAEELAQRSEHRVRTRQQAVARLPQTMVALYLPHILKELAGLLEEIRKEEAVRSRQVFEVVFSSLVVKLSNKKADTSDDLVEKRLRKGLPTELFLRKCKELVHRWESLERALPRDEDGNLPPRARVLVGDARELPQLLDPRVRISTIVTSPPYGGTYDYQAQHALRLAWLGIDTSEFLEGEIGSRRANLSPKAGVARWNEELVLVLRSMRTVLDDRGRILVLIGDGEVGGEPVPALRQLLELAPHADLEVVAAASVERPDFRLPGGAREEHAIALRPR